MAAAVILPKDFYNERINDSKKLSAATLREELFSVIRKNALGYAYTIISQNKIDEINILKASLLAMKRSVEKLKVQPRYNSC